MIFNLRKDVAWLEVRLNRRPGYARNVKHFGKKFQVLNPPSSGWQLVIKDMWAGPLVIRLEHWRSVDA